MKTNLLPAAFLVLATTLLAAPLKETTAVHTQPDASSAAITFLTAGTEPTPATSALASTPAGWMAVELPGPFEVYVENKDLTKSLDVRPGTPLRLAPQADGGVLTIAEKDEKINITGLRGRWTQLSLDKKIVGYINVGGVAGYMPPIATTPAGAVPSTAATPVVPSETGPAAVTPAPTPISPAPVAPAAYGVTTPGQPAPMVNLGDGGPASLPRQFAGKFVTTRRPLTPRRPFDWALNDDAGKRYAYLDVSKLLQTDQIEKYANRQVFVFGTARSSADGRELVIQVESLQLR